MTDVGTIGATDFREVLAVDSIPPEGWRGVIEAPQDALAAIAMRIGAPKLLHLRGEFEVTPVARAVRLSGVVDAALERVCVASLETIDEVVHEPFEITFSGETEDGDIVELDLTEDAPEPLEDGRIDLAETLVQQLVLAMAPYPRKAGAASLADEYGGSEPASPFEILKTAIAGAGEQG
jgi:hypothetical protein